jgi:hypothetical protein
MAPRLSLCQRFVLLCQLVGIAGIAFGCCVELGVTATRGAGAQTFDRRDALVLTAGLPSKAERTRVS